MILGTIFFLEIREKEPAREKVKGERTNLEWNLNMKQK